jgi:hypothetical protein
MYTTYARVPGTYIRRAPVGRGLRALGWGKAKAAPKRRPSAAKSIIRAEVPKDTGPIHLQASFFRAAAAGHALVLDYLAIKVVLGLDNAAKEHPAVHAGVGAL